jgi:hypothetical protein
VSAASISFFASAVIALLAALAAVIARRRERGLAGAAICFAALLVPLVQLGAPAVAAVILLGAALLVLVLGMLARLDAREVGRAPRRAVIAYWLPAGLGLLGFVWVLLATGSRQVVDLGKPLPPGSRFADGSAVLIGLGNEFVVPALLVGLLALASVIAAVLGLVGGRVGEA